MSALPLDDDGFIYLTKQFRYALEREDLGKIETVKMKFDDARLCTKTMKSKKIFIRNHALNMNQHEKYSNYLVFFRVNPWFQSVFVQSHDAQEKVMTGEITHGQTVALILKANHYLSNLKK